MKNFIAAVRDDYSDRIEELAETLRGKGCEISRILKITGVITGTVKSSIKLRDLKIEGIRSVELQKKIRKI